MHRSEKKVLWQTAEKLAFGHPFALLFMQVLREPIAPGKNTGI